MEIQALSPNQKHVSLLMAAMATPLLFGAVALWFIFTHGPVAGWPFMALVWAVAFLVAGIGGLAGLWLYAANARLLIGVDRFGYRDLLRRSRTWSPRDVDRVVDMAIVYAGERPERAVFLLGVHGRRLLTLHPEYWSGDAIDQLVSATKRPVDVRRDPISVKEAHREFPRAFGWVASHVFLFGTAACGAAVLFVVVLSAIVRAVSPAS